MIPVIAIVGRPNTGKSTLFNRLIGSRVAIISKIPGTTRDRIYQFGKINEYKVFFADTGGIIVNAEEDIEKEVVTQAKIAIEEADIILFVIDGASPITEDDYSAAEMLRKSKKEVIFIANKSDSSKFELNISEYYRLGFKNIVKISAIHGRGIDELIEKIYEDLKSKNIKPFKEEIGTGALNIAVLGRPNTGKSSLVNAFLGEERIIVSAIPGTTRDTIDTEIKFNDKIYNLIDTAGIRRKGKQKYFMEKLSVLRGLSALARSDIAILLLDGSEKIAHQDCGIAGFIISEKKGLIIAVNKSDLFKSEEEKNKYLWNIKRNFDFLPWAPVVFVSAKTHENIEKLLELSDEINKEREKQIPQKEFEEFLTETIFEHTGGVMIRGKPFISASQTNICPPEFTITVKNPDRFNFSYKRYLENSIRKKYGFTGTAIRLILKKP